MSQTTAQTRTANSGVDLDDSNQLQSQLHGSLEASLTRHSSTEQPSLEDAYEIRSATLPRSSAVIVITALSGITFVGSMSTGLLTIGLPTIARDLSLPDNLLLW